MIIQEYQNINTFLKKDYTLNSSDKVFMVKKVDNSVPWAFVISDLNGKEIVGTFYKKD